MNDGEILKSEVKAMWDYTNRDTYNLAVIYEMCKQIQITIKGMVKPKIRKELENK